MNNCFQCKNHRLCFLRKSIGDAITKGIDLLNIDGDARPGRYMAIYTALAEACMEFEEEEEEDQ